MPISPLAMAQNNEKVGELMQFLQIAQSLGPAGVMGVKMDKITDYVGDLMGIPADLRTTPEERAMMAQEMSPFHSSTALVLVAHDACSGWVPISSRQPGMHRAKSLPCSKMREATEMCRASLHSDMNWRESTGVIEPRTPTRQFPRFSLCSID
ncbi:MAG: hypothetical protein DSY92_05365 [Planctomycetota bacterium]|nr:MAG: hypothetical protein DSY92_05365 [Planctomycetota bacterium]